MRTTDGESSKAMHSLPSSCLTITNRRSGNRPLGEENTAATCAPSWIAFTTSATGAHLGPQHMADMAVGAKADLRDRKGASDFTGHRAGTFTLVSQG